MADNEKFATLAHLSVVKDYIDRKDNIVTDNIGVVTNEQGALGIRVINGKVQYKNENQLWTDITFSNTDNPDSTNITDSSFNIMFKTLDTVNLSGVWDSTNLRIKF